MFQTKRTIPEVRERHPGGTQRQDSPDHKLLLRLPDHAAHPLVGTEVPTFWRLAPYYSGGAKVSVNICNFTKTHLFNINNLYYYIL